MVVIHVEFWEKIRQGKIPTPNIFNKYSKVCITMTASKINSYFVTHYC